MYLMLLLFLYQQNRHSMKHYQAYSFYICKLLLKSTYKESKNSLKYTKHTVSIYAHTRVLSYLTLCNIIIFLSQVSVRRDKPDCSVCVRK